MNFKVTEQHARTEEKLIADLSELNDTRIFVSKKSALAEAEKQRLIFRIYGDSELLQEINRYNISVSSAHYAEGNRDIEYSSGLQFHVMIKATDSKEKKNIANFSNQNNALLFIMSKCEMDNTVLNNDLFFIYKERDLIDTLSKIICSHRNKKPISSQGNEKGAVFRPTPLPSRPTPPGGPSDYWVENEDEK